jgi:hypothetical protein
MKNHQQESRINSKIIYMGLLTTQKHTLSVINTKTTQILLNRKENKF